MSGAGPPFIPSYLKRLVGEKVFIPSSPPTKSLVLGIKRERRDRARKDGYMMKARIS